MTDFLTQVPSYSLGATDPLLTSPIQAQAQAPAVNGPFKTKGAVADILGSIMDMVLVGGGLQASYGPRKLAAQQAQAYASSGGNRNQLIQNLLGAGAGREAMDVYAIDAAEPLQEARIRAADATAESQALVRRAQAANARQKILEEVYAAAGTVDEKNAPALGKFLRKQLNMYAESDPSFADLAPDAVGFPDTDDPAAIKAWAGRGVPMASRYAADTAAPYKQAAVRQGDARIAVAETNAETSGRRADIAEAALEERTTNNKRRGDQKDEEIDIRRNNPPGGRQKPSVSKGPPMSAAEYKGKTLSFKNGTTWFSNGKSWTKVK